MACGGCGSGNTDHVSVQTGDEFCVPCWEADGGVQCDLMCGSETTRDDAEFWGRWYGPGQWTGDTATQNHVMWVCGHCVGKLTVSVG